MLVVVDVQYFIYVSLIKVGKLRLCVMRRYTVLLLVAKQIRGTFFLALCLVSLVVVLHDRMIR